MLCALYPTTKTGHPRYLRKPDNNAEQSVHGFVTMPLALAKEVISHRQQAILQQVGRHLTIFYNTILFSIRGEH